MIFQNFERYEGLQEFDEQVFQQNQAVDKIVQFQRHTENLKEQIISVWFNNKF